MKEFIMIFRRDYLTREKQPSTQALISHLLHWRKWLKTLEESGRLARRVDLLDKEGRILRKGIPPACGPYTEINHSVGGILFIYARDYRQVIEMCQACPVFAWDGCIEIRRIGPGQQNQPASFDISCGLLSSSKHKRGINQIINP